MHYGCISISVALALKFNYFSNITFSFSCRYIGEIKISNKLVVILLKFSNIFLDDSKQHNQIFIIIKLPIISQNIVQELIFQASFEEVVVDKYYFGSISALSFISVNYNDTSFYDTEGSSALSILYCLLFLHTISDLLSPYIVIPLVYSNELW